MLKMSILPFAAIVLASVCVLAGDLPKRSIQHISTESERKKAHLQSDELLMVEISNPSGNATGMTIDYGSTGLKLLHSGIRRDTTDEGGLVFGSQNVVLLFQATKPASGKLKVKLDQTFAKTEPFQLDVVVKPPAGDVARQGK